MFLKSDDAEISYHLLGSGPAVVLLHPFPVNHHFWGPVARGLESHYQLLMPDLRGIGASGVGDGPSTMQKHARDIARLCDECRIDRAVFVGVSIGGYILFEFWRQFRDRVQALVLSDTKAEPDTDEARAGRLKSADDIERDGVEPFLDGLFPKLIGASTFRNRPDIVADARRMAMSAAPEGIAAALLGMGVRPDSVPTLRTIDVPTLLIYGEEDILTPAADANLIHGQVRGSVLHMVPRAGHYAFLEQPDDCIRPLRNFLDMVYGKP
jgi:3-oxoadipate enol-lactonase